MKKPVAISLLLLAMFALSPPTYAQSKKNYLNRARLMLAFAVRTNEYVRQRLLDRDLANYAHAMAETNVLEAEKMTPPNNLSLLHPHLLLVLENTERTLAHAKKGDLGKYRKQARTLKKEMQLLEAIAERERVDLYLWGQTP